MSVLFMLGMAAAVCSPHHVGDLVIGPGDSIPPCLETVEGNLLVGSGEALLTFSELTDVTGRVELTLAGSGRAHFPRLERIHAGLEVKTDGGPALDFPVLQYVSGPVGVEIQARADQPSRAMSGFPSIRRLHGGLWIFGQGDMSGLLPKLRSVEGTVFIRPSGPLRGVLAGVEQIGGHLVASNGGHARLEGFTRLMRVDGGVYIFGGQELEMSALREVGGALAIRDSKLRSLDGIGVPGVRVGALLLRDNPLLARLPRHLDVPRDRVEVRGSPAFETALKRAESAYSP